MSNDTGTAVALVLANAFEAAKHIAPLIVPGATPMIEAGQALLRAMDAGKDLVGGSYGPIMEAERAALEAKVRAHVHDTASRLRG